jgi:PPOX class probable FMN-dependent enzyme
MATLRAAAEDAAGRPRAFLAYHSTHRDEQEGDAMANETIDSVGALHELYGPPGELALKKQLSRLDKHCRAFIALSPFLVIASSSLEGACDASPRGDQPGFVAVIDDHTLIIPDRRGNNRVDTLENVVANPHVGLLFLVPGMQETLRINGSARVVEDSDLLAPLAVNGQMPRTGLLVTVEDAYLQCGKALLRSDLWNPEKQIERSAFPSLGRVLSEQIAGVDAETAECSVEESYRTRLY